MPTKALFAGQETTKKDTFISRLIPCNFRLIVSEYKMKANAKLYTYWLILVSSVIIIAGLVIAIIAPYVMPSIQDLFYRSFNEQPIESISAYDKNHINWIYAVLGGTLVGWGLMMLRLSTRLLQNNDQAIWNTILICVLAWFVIDTTISIKYMVIPNLILNVAILAAILIPYIGNTRTRQ
jgi:hypothetical protein